MEHDTHLVTIAAAAVEAPHIAALARLAGPDVGPQLAQVLTELMRQTRKANSIYTPAEVSWNALRILKDAADAAYVEMLE